jgi:hypothetical protein
MNKEKKMKAISENRKNNRKKKKAFLLWVKPADGVAKYGK